MRRAFVILLLVLGGPALAQDRTHDITPDDFFTLKSITELAVSPDGKQVAYCVASWDVKADNRKTDLWVVPADGKGTPRQLTSARANDRHPKWAADGKGVYVLANRKTEGEKKPPLDGSAQVWLVPLEGGEPTAVTKADGGVTGFDYAPKTDAVFYSADTSATDEDDFTKLRQKFDRPEYGHGKRKVSEVFRINKDGQPEKVIAEKRYLHELAVTADGKRVAMITAPDDTVVTFEGRSRVDVWDADTKKVTPTDEGWRKTAASPWPWLESLAWSPDGYRLAFCEVYDAHPAEIIIQEWKDGKWAATRMKRSPGTQVRGYGTPLRWSSATVLTFLWEAHGAVGWWHRSVTDPGDMGRLHQSGVTYGFESIGQVQIDKASDDQGIAIIGFPWAFPELSRWPGKRIPGRWGEPLTDHNPQTKTWKLPTVEQITWTAPDGALVGGVLELPHGYKKGEKKLPLVVAIHGGPTTASHTGLHFDPLNGRLYFAAKGYAVLCPNYRGSTGYGDKFVTDLIGNENDIEVKDIIAGIQHLIKEGIVDPDRIAVTGWSNGGYLTNCLITLKDPPVKFKAASSGAGILDCVAEWGFNDEPAYPTVFKKGLPWEKPEIYRKTSPTYGLGNVKTPTLIHVGGSDERCPPGHSRMLYRALREYVKVPTELVVYPGEPHGLTKASNLKAKMEWDLAWFDKYMLHSEK
jgi:dipeptidyl aminopeptidase/acylaminoacyl peptidase